MANDSELDAGALFRLDGRVILVTGAAGHLGRALTRVLARAGVVVIANGRSPEKLARLAEEHAAAGRIEPMPFDATSQTDIAAAARSIAEKYGRLDGIVNNAYAGLKERRPVAGVEEFTAAAAINMAAPYMIVEACRKLLGDTAPKNMGGTSVVNIASMYGVVSPDPRIYKDAAALANPPFYGASKAGMIQLTRYLACHLAAEKIRVNAVVPGAFPSPEVLDRFPRFEAAVREKIPAGRIGVPIELTGPVVFLLSDAASYVSGAVVHVDGGLTAW